MDETPALVPDQALPDRELDLDQTEMDLGAVSDQRAALADIGAVLAAARATQRILFGRGRLAVPDSDDVMRRREAEALREASERASAVRQDPAPSRGAMSLELDELELEAGH